MPIMQCCYIVTETIFHLDVALSVRRPRQRTCCRHVQVLVLHFHPTRPPLSALVCGTAGFGSSKVLLIGVSGTVTGWSLPGTAVYSACQRLFVKWAWLVPANIDSRRCLFAPDAESTWCTVTTHTLCNSNRWVRIVVQYCQVHVCLATDHQPQAK